MPQKQRRKRKAREKRSRRTGDPWTVMTTSLEASRSMASGSGSHIQAQMESEGGNQQWRPMTRNLTPEERRRRALDRMMDAALKGGKTQVTGTEGRDSKTTSMESTDCCTDRHAGPGSHGRPRNHRHAESYASSSRGRRQTRSHVASQLLRN